MHFCVLSRGVMDEFRLCIFVLGILFNVVLVNSDYFITLSHNAPAVLGATVTFTADLYTTRDERPTGNFGYQFDDNAIPQHSYQVFGTPNTTVLWNVSYPRVNYPPGSYTAQVVGYVHTWYYTERTSQRTSFNITDTLNGEIKLEQTGTLDADHVVANTRPVTHSISLLPADLQYLTAQATEVLTFWFVDCQYYGYSTDSSFTFNYTQKKTYDVEALVVASFDTPEPTTTPATTTTTTTSVTPGTSETTSASSVSSTTTASTPVPKSTLTPSIGIGANASTLQKPATFFPAENSTLGPNLTGVHSYACLNSTFVPPDPNKTYGYFRKKISSIAPVSNVVVKGNNWLQSGDMLDLNITCNGTAAFFHCAKIKPGVYNVTGNETCASSLETNECSFSLRHLFREASTYTIVIIISNDVSKVVQQSVIRMYTVTRQPQLSVIVVPVTFSVLTIILIVFGVAYYVQSRTRFTVEVADFDFGQANEMEYKTFYERLRDDLSNIFSRTGIVADETNVNSARDKYDNMENS